jgi:hypothetical protein
MTEETEVKEKKNDRVSFWPMVVFVVFVLALWLGNMYWGIHEFKADENAGTFEDRGTFGDVFGAVNALFSGLAFAGLIFTILLQRKDLKLQFSELSRQADETKRTADQFEKQQQLTSYQLIQSTVNNLIDVKNTHLDKLKFEISDGSSKEIYYGSDAIDMIFRYHGGAPSYVKRLLSVQVMKQYYRTFFYILQFINDSNIDDVQKKTLIDTLNLQTLDSEINVIYSFYENSQHELALLKRYGFYDRQVASSE